MFCGLGGFGGLSTAFEVGEGCEILTLEVYGLLGVVAFCLLQALRPFIAHKSLGRDPKQPNHQQ